MFANYLSNHTLLPAHSLLSASLTFGYFTLQSLLPLFQPWQCLEWSVDNSWKLLHKIWHFVHEQTAGSLILELEGSSATRSSECVEKGHSFSHCYAQICGDCVQGVRFGCLSNFEGVPDFCSRIQSLDVMENYSVYDNIRISTILFYSILF